MKASTLVLVPLAVAVAAFSPHSNLAESTATDFLLLGLIEAVSCHLQQWASVVAGCAAAVDGGVMKGHPFRDGSLR